MAARLALAALVCLAAAGCRTAGTAPAPETERVPVEVVTVETGDVDVTVKAVGSLEAQQVVELKLKRPGHVRELHIQEGARVEAGATLVRLEDDALRAQVEQARANLADAEVRWRNAGRQHERTRALLDQGIAARQQYDDIQAELERASAVAGVAKANLAFSEAQLAETVLVAPFAGVLGQRRVDVGAFVKEGEPLATLVDSDPVEIVFAVPERHLPQIRLGLPARTAVASHPGRSFPGEVTFVDPQVDPVNRTVTVKAVLPNPELLLHPGQFAAVELDLERHVNVPVIPEEALVADGERAQVYVVADGTATARPVRTGVRLPGRVEVADGLVAGETIVRTGHEKLRPDAATPVAPVSGPREG
jgi:membrane fusion protein (multidrug efflux system)